MINYITQAAANKAAEEGGLPDLRDWIIRNMPVGMVVGDPAWWADRIVAQADRASRQDHAPSILRDMLVIQEACGLHTDEYAPGSVIEYIKELEAESASRQVANKAQHDIWGPNGEFAEFYVAGLEGREICPTTKGNALAAYSDGIKDRFANKAEDGGKIMPAKLSYDMWRAWEGISNCLSADQMGEIYDAMYEVVPPTNKAEVEPRQPTDISSQLRGYASNPGYSHNDYADTMLQAANTIESLLATPPATTGASTAGLESILDKLEDAIGGYSGGPFDKVQAIIDELRASPDCGACPGDGSMCKSGCKVEEESPASTVLTDERIAELYEETTSYTLEDDDYAGVRAFAQAIAREVAAQAGQVAAPADMTAAADFIDKRAEQYLQDHADNENDTGSVAFHYGEAGREYHSVLVELADDLRQASKPAACTVPPTGWNCTRTAGHEGPCAAAPSPAKESK